MADPIVVPAPDLREQLRQLATAIADLHRVTNIVVENAKQFVPGEAVDDLRSAWTSSQGSMRELVSRLLPDSDPLGDMTRALEHPTHPWPDFIPDLRKGDLLGEVGKFKTSMLGRLKDRFFMFWNSEPRTDEKRQNAAEAACDHLELGCTVVGSIPGYEKVVEILSLTTQLIGFRTKRGV